ncbi:dTDP-4-dehydrorhamnose 3,5-epimerase [Roseiterribacter gracilis]|uniref:dTDP-4-dehydrorhamnose 3,5-epimerase n=1 Tax=Roseiterribacter gracilis TaxID=2812848 RepID=A0A8S8XBZ8_9PROT|nr:dTDP-4-dehydrorhamnose 3,5-epimerase [Rhodospirillales bacterium TMPK1]
MRVDATSLPGVQLITPVRHGDARGFFSETYVESRYETAGIPVRFVQDNHAMSAAIGTVRGLHWQIGANAQDKLVRVTRGAIFDVAVDIRRASPTFGQWVGVELSAANWSQLFVPIGFAHGYCTLHPDTEVLYKTSAVYDSGAERSVRWDDPAIGISWPPVVDPALLSNKDRIAPLLADAQDLF